MEYDEHGWISFEVDLTSEQNARGRANRQNVKPVEGGIEATWIGYLGEDVALRYFETEGNGAKANGGIDALPDLEVVGLGGVDVKTQGTLLAAFEPHFSVCYAAKHLVKPATDALVFAVFFEHEKKLTILGAKSSRGFFTEASFIRQGEPFFGREGGAMLDAFVLPISALLPARKLIDRIKATS